MKLCSTCLEDGKESKVYGLGYCSKHYQKFKLYGDPKKGASYERHGMKGTPEYNTWQNIKDRCTNPKNQDYHIYMGKGIGICDEWKNSFVKFFEHVGKRPEGMTSLDRIDSNKNYEPGNVRWADATTQARNKGIYKNNKSGYPGVWWNKTNNNWRVGINVDGKNIELGSFPRDEKEKAIKVRKEAELKYWK